MGSFVHESHDVGTLKMANNPQEAGMITEVTSQSPMSTFCFSKCHSQLKVPIQKQTYFYLQTVSNDIKKADEGFYIVERSP